MPIKEGDVLPLCLEVIGQGVDPDEDPVVAIAEQDVGFPPLPFAGIHVHLPNPSMADPLEKEGAFDKNYLVLPVILHNTTWKRRREAL